MSKRSATTRGADGRRKGPRGGLPAIETAALRSFDGGDPNDDDVVGLGRGFKEESREEGLVIL